MNDELGQLDRALPLAWDILRTDGRFGAISFHSLEDRRVKRFLADLARGCVCPPELPVCVCGHEPQAELLTRGGIVPGADEIAANPRARSARLRAARKLEALMAADPVAAPPRPRTPPSAARPPLRRAPAAARARRRRGPRRRAQRRPDRRAQRRAARARAARAPGVRGAVALPAPSRRSRSSRRCARCPTPAGSTACCAARAGSS